MVSAIAKLLEELPRAMISVAKMALSGGCRASLLMELSIDLQLGPMIKNEALGIYFDIGPATWKKILSHDMTPQERLYYVHTLAKGMFREENDVTVGFYTASAVKLTNSIGIEVEA